MPAELPTNADTVIMFGDGTRFKYVHHTPLVVGGTAYNEFMMIPTPETIKKLGIKFPDDYYPQDRRIIVRRYKASDCDQINNSTYYNSWVLFVDFYDNPCRWIDKYCGDLRINIENAEKLINELKNELARLHDEHNLSVTHPTEFRNKYLEQLQKEKNLIGTTTITGGTISTNSPNEGENG